MPRKPSAFHSWPISFGVARAQGRYRAVCDYVVDGDTVDCLIDVGFGLYAYRAIRVDGVDTPEIYRPKSDAEKQLGMMAKQTVTSLLMATTPILLEVMGYSFDRIVAALFYYNEGEWIDLADTLKDRKLTKADVTAETTGG